MGHHSLFSRLKRARLVRVLAVYLAASWGLLQVVEVLQDGLGLPTWVMPVTLILLSVGFVIVVATAWVQSHPLMEAREAADEVPGDWDLDLSEAIASLFRGRIPHPNWARAIMGGIVVFSLLFGIAGLYVVIQDRDRSLQPASLLAGEPATLAVLPFRASGAALEEWEEGMVDLLSTGLDGAAGLRTVNGRTVLSHWNRELSGSETPDLSTALRIARGMGARFALEGSVVSLGNAVRLSARVHDLEENRQLGTAQVEGSLESPNDLVDRLGLEVLQVLLGGEVSDLPRIDLAAVTTTSSEALKAYLEGERHYRHARWSEAAAAYQRAVAIDSTFALAHHRLFLTLGWIDPGSALQRRHGALAREWADRLPERERLLVDGIYRMVRSERDPTILENPIEEAVRLYPNDAEAWYLLAETYFHQQEVIMRPTELEAIFERAISLDPTFAAYRIHSVQYALYFHGDSALAARRVAEYREAANHDDPFLLQFEATLELMFGDRPAHVTTSDRDDLFFLRSGSYRLVFPLSSPHLLGALEVLLRERIDDAQGRQNPPEPIPILLRELTRTLLNQGKHAAALELLDHPALSDTEEQRCLLMEFRFLDVPLPAAVMRSAIGGPGDGNGSPTDTFCRTLLAADAGVQASFEAGRDRLEAIERDDLAVLADTYWKWRREGSLEEAAHTLMTESGAGTTGYWKFWLGEIQRELGRLDAAEEAYLATLHPNDPYLYTKVWYRLAGLYDEMGDTANARDAWQRVMIAWEDADPEVQPRVEEARARLAGLP